ncbi:MAG: FAD-dependent oxidoreductase [Mariprofundaceae bacterium]|nr:FAD-dependent oxidoreductase [Mariprofundaceae bacterium]
MLIRLSNLSIPLDTQNQALTKLLSQYLEIPSQDIRDIHIVRRALDARKRLDVHFVCSIECRIPEDCPLPARAVKIETSSLNISKPLQLQASPSQQAQHVVVVGAGPAGLFAALSLAEAGIQVTLLERGKPVEKRMRDIGRLRSRGELNTESNICFGEGGAGTYTDGKLYTRIKHPFVRWVLAEFVRFGAKENILVDAHPHLGTDKLVRIVRNMRQHLMDLGVDYRFESKVVSLLTKQNQVQGVRLASGDEILAPHVMLAIGHSARDTIESLYKQGIEVEAKDFAVGVRAEHSQAWVNESQYGHAANHPALGAAEYRLAHQVKDAHIGQRGVYSFCMCPGGLIVPSPTEHGMMAVNGMSNGHRRSPLANSGIVVQITSKDMQRQGLGNDALSGIRLQRSLEKKCFEMASTPYAAPAMRIIDFVQGNATGLLAKTRFKPNAEAANLHELFPTWLSKPLCEGFRAFDQKMRGYITADANILAVESRTSSPVRFLREKNMQATRLSGLYPIGEGAGYAGGIVSAAVDGLKAAAKVIQLAEK